LKNDVENFMSQNGFTKLIDSVEGISGDQLYINKSFKNKNRHKHSSFSGKLISKLITQNNDRLSFDDGSKMIVPDDMAWSFDKNGYYEKNLDEWLRRLCRHLYSPVLYDIGANYGYYTTNLAFWCKSVYAFEPVGQTFKVLNSNILLNHLDNVKTYKLALSNESGNSYINVYTSSGNNSTFLRNLPEGHPTKFKKRERINLTTLDNFVEGVSEGPDIMKIDVEGGELNVLKGASKVIKKYQPIIVMEYSVGTSNDAGYDRSELLNELKLLGYKKIYGLSEDVKDNKLYRANKKLDKIENLIAVPNKIDIEKWL